MNEYVLTYVSIHIYLIRLSNNPNKKEEEEEKIHSLFVQIQHYRFSRDNFAIGQYFSLIIR